MRQLHKSWKGKIIDGKLQPVRHSFTHRIRWYEGTTIRLNLQDEEGAFNHYPDCEETAEEMIKNFKKQRINARGVKI